MRFDFTTPPRIVFGAGSLREAAPAARALSRHAFVVTGRDPSRAACLLEKRRHDQLHERLEDHRAAQRAQEHFHDDPHAEQHLAVDCEGIGDAHALKSEAFDETACDHDDDEQQ